MRARGVDGDFVSAPVLQRARDVIQLVHWWEKVGEGIVRHEGKKPGGYRLVKGVKAPDDMPVFETKEQRATHVEKPKTYEELLGELPDVDSGVEFLVKADLVRYSQDSISSKFKDESSIFDLARSLGNSTKKPRDLPAIRVFKSSEGRLVSLDNRRLWCCKEAGTEVLCTWASQQAIEDEGFKFTSGKGLKGRTTIDVRK